LLVSSVTGEDGCGTERIDSQKRVQRSFRQKKNKRGDVSISKTGGGGLRRGGEELADDRNAERNPEKWGGLSFPHYCLRGEMCVGGGKGAAGGLWGGWTPKKRQRLPERHSTGVKTFSPTRAPKCNGRENDNRTFDPIGHPERRGTNPPRNQAKARLGQIQGKLV